MFKNVTILEFDDDIQIHHEKCIEINTNMPSIGLEIALKFHNFKATNCNISLANWHFFYARR